MHGKLVEITPYHAKYFAYELTKRSSSDSIQKLVTSLMDAQVDLNPHQVEKERKKVETERDEAWREYNNAAKEIENSKDKLIDEIEEKMQQKTDTKELFTIK